MSQPRTASGTCTRCKEPTDDPVTPAVPLRWDKGDVCPDCNLDLFDISMGREPRSGRDLPSPT